MDGELALDDGAWLKGDLLKDFSDLLDADPGRDGELARCAGSLGGADLLGAPGVAQHTDLSTDQVAHADWLKGLMGGVAAPPQPAGGMMMPAPSAPQPFPGFPAAGLLSAALGPAPVPCTAPMPMSCTRLHEDAALTPSSWESTLSSFSLESSLVELPAMPEPAAELLGGAAAAPAAAGGRGRRLKSENSFATSELDSRDTTTRARGEAKTEPKAINSKPAKEHSPATKASLADRNRERQQRFRQRQKQKIESLETQVVRLTQQTQQLAAEREDLNGRAAKLSELLQARDRHLMNLTSQLSQLRCGAGAGDASDCAQLTLTYCSPPLVLGKAEMQAMSGGELCKLWKGYVWQMSELLAGGDDFAGVWSRASERLDALTSELVQLMMHLWDCCPEFARIKATGCLEEGLPAEDCHGRWQSIAAALSLSHEQVSSLLALRHSMRTRLRQIWAQRREAHTGMLACLEEDLACSRDIALQHLKVRRGKEAMDEGLKQEGLLARDFEFAFYKKVLRPDQRAVCMVRAFPFFPDSQALANWVAASAGDREAQCLMTMHTTSSTTSYHSNS